MDQEKQKKARPDEVLHNKDRIPEILTLEPVSLGHGSGEAEEAFHLLWPSIRGHNKNSDLLDFSDFTRSGPRLGFSSFTL